MERSDYRLGIDMGFRRIETLIRNGADSSVWERELRAIGMVNWIPDLFEPDQLGFIHGTLDGIVVVEGEWDRLSEGQYLHSLDSSKTFYILFLDIHRLGDGLSGVVVGPFRNLSEAKTCPEVLERLVTRRMTSGN